MKNKNKPYKILHINDIHLGLKIEGVDQTPYFEKILMNFVAYGAKLKEQKYDVVLIFGGDIFDNNDPSEDLIGVVIRVMCAIKEAELNAYFNVGNHESSHNPDRLSALTFIKDAADAFPTIRLVEDITMVDKGDCVEGVLYFTFLPHVSKALIKSKNLSLSPQEYIETKCDKIVKKMEGMLGINLVFSHLNVKGVHAGSEANLLKRSDVYVPNLLMQDVYLGMKPTIIQSHIHNRSNDRNMHIVGSPVFCSFNEEGEKGFAEITVGKQIDQDFKIEYVPTNPPEFLSVEVDLREDEGIDFFKHEAVSKIMSMREDKIYIIKFNVTVSAQNNNYNWDIIRNTIQEKFKESIIKQIVPRIMSDRITRNSKQKLGLAPEEAIKVFIKKNWGKDIPKAKKIYKFSKKYLSSEHTGKN